jgi:hypothetical protein
MQYKRVYSVRRMTWGEIVIAKYDTVMLGFWRTWCK